jgi:hypothetical protein
MSGVDASEGERIITTSCPECEAELSLRLPPDQKSGEFSFTCDECGSEQNVVVGPKGAKKFRTVSRRKVLKRAEEVIFKPSRKMRLKVSAAFLVIAGILGLIFSLMTVTESFTIKDIEQQTEGEYTTLTVAVIDSTTGRPVTDALVSLSGGSGNLTGYTDLAGLFVLQGVPPGTSTISLTKDGYKTVRSEITLRKGTPNVLDIPMEEGDPMETIPIRTTQFVTKDYSTLVTNVMALIMFLTSIVSLISAYFTFRGEFFALSLVGAFVSIFSIGFVIGSVLSLIATIVITFSYNEFTHTHVLKRLLDLRKRGELIGGFRKEQA